MKYEIRLATVIDTKCPTKLGSFQAKLVGDEIIVPVVMTSPLGSRPVSDDFYSYAGMFGNPTLWTQILIKKIDDSGYWYFDSVPANTYLVPTEKDDGKPVLTKATLRSLHSIGDSVETFSHARSPQKYGIISPEGHKLVLSDSHNDVDRELFCKLESKTHQRALFSTTTGVAALRNEKNDGLLLTSHYYKGLYGPRSIRMCTFGNITEYTTNGQMTFKVGSAGRVFNMWNEAIYGFNSAGIDSDNDVGSINIESYENDITVKVNRKASGRRIFIDASQSDGLVCVKTGSGGVEIYTDGDINIACSGDFNLRAQGDINLKGNIIQLNPTYELDYVEKEDFTKDNKELAEEAAPQ